LINHLRIPGGVPNEAGLSYLEQVEKTVKPYGGKWLAMGNVKVIEGAWPGSVVLMEFPTTEDAQNWYNSPEYQQIIYPRIENSLSDMILVDGISSGFTVSELAQQIRAGLSAQEPRRIQPTSIQQKPPEGA
jgi:uncharacterized protein (DUF1330 family)